MSTLFAWRLIFLKWYCRVYMPGKFFYERDNLLEKDIQCRFKEPKK